MTQRDQYYSSTYNCFKGIYKEEGYKAFAKGIHIRTLSIGFSGIIFFGVYENVKLTLNKIVPNF